MSDDEFNALAPVKVLHPEPTMAVAVRQEQPVGLFGTSEPAVVMQKAVALADVLKDVIVKQGLVSTISGRQYPRCEAWTLLGTMLGVFPVTVWTKQVEGGWEARVEARTKDGSVIGAAEAQCLTSEKNWSNRDDFALRSMAQTRATAKCLRMPLGFVMTLSGFEATPAEEMTFEQAKPATGRTETPRQGVGSPRVVSTHPPAAKSYPTFPAPLKGTVQAQAAAPTTSAAATPGYRTRMIQRLHATLGEATRDLVTSYFRGAGMLMPNEAIEDLDLCWVPISEAEMGLLGARLAEYERGDGAEKPFPAHDLPAKKAVEVPRQPELATPEAAEEWRSWPCPFGKHAGVPLEDLDPKYLYGFWKGFTVETEYNGRPKKPETIAKDTKFREMLDAAGVSRGYK